MVYSYLAFFPSSSPRLLLLQSIPVDLHRAGRREGGGRDLNGTKHLGLNCIHLYICTYVQTCILYRSPFLRTGGPRTKVDRSQIFRPRRSFSARPRFRRVSNNYIGAWLPKVVRGTEATQKACEIRCSLCFARFAALFSPEHFC